MKEITPLGWGLALIDISDPRRPRETGGVAWDQKKSTAEILRSEGSYVYIAAGPVCSLVVVDVKDANKPTVIGTFKSIEGACGEGLDVRDGWVYLANGNLKHPEDSGLFIIDARKPKFLSVKGKLLFQGWVEGVYLLDHYAFIMNTDLGIRSIDISDPENPRLVDHYGPKNGR